MYNPDDLARRLKLNPNSATTKQLLANIKSTVHSFVSRFRQARIIQQLPSDVLNLTLEEALQHSTKVRKLLTDGRFVK